jgi:hypothetical protein
VLPDLGKGSDGPKIESVLPDVGKESWKGALMTPRNGALAALGLAILLAIFGMMNNRPARESPRERKVAPTIAADGSFSVGDKKYYRVVADDPSRDTGNKACAQAGKTCVGYTALDLDVCLAFHQGAQTQSDLDGSKAGFYCNGAPQGGVCAKEANTCHICPKCNLNMECHTEIKDLYRETFVQCE